jgi:hypothetical protein
VSVSGSLNSGAFPSGTPAGTTIPPPGASYLSPTSTLPVSPLGSTTSVNVPSPTNLSTSRTSLTPLEIDGRAAMALGHIRQKSAEELQAIFNNAVHWCLFCFHFGGIKEGHYRSGTDGHPDPCPHWVWIRCFRCYGIHMADACPIPREDVNVRTYGTCFGCYSNLRVVAHGQGKIGLKCEFKDWINTRVIAFLACLFGDVGIKEAMERGVGETFTRGKYGFLAGPSDFFSHRRDRCADRPPGAAMADERDKPA